MAPAPLPPSARLGLIAGFGTFPIEVARAARARGMTVVCAGIRREALPALANEVDVFRPIGLCRLGAFLRFFHAHGVHYITWAGAIRKDTLFSLRGLLAHRPDLRALRFFWRRLRRIGWQSQTILTALAQEFEANGFELTESTAACPDLLVGEGVIGKHRPTPKQNEDIAFGWRIAKRMADLDVGQSVAVCDKATIAVEGMEGTDRNIQRAGELCKRRFTVVKVAMQHHDMRFDVPTIGPQTIRVLAQAGGAVLAIEAGKTILLDRDEVIALADKAGIVIVAVSGLPT